MGQKDNDPHKKLESLERWSGRATLIIFGGFVLEVFSLFWVSHTTWDRIAGSVANSLIGVGLIIEYIVIGRAIVATGEANRLSDEKVAEANKIAAQAVKDAAEARERTAEIERLTAWRHVEPEFRAKILDVFLNTSIFINVAIEYQNGDSEANSYAIEFAQMFSEIGFEKIVFQANFHLNLTQFGVVIRVGKCEKSDLICKLCSNAFGVSPMPEDFASIFGAGVDAPNLYLFVGPKPPPEFGSVPGARETE